MDYNKSQYDVVWKPKQKRYQCLMYIVLTKTIEKGEEILVDYHYGSVDQRHLQTLRKNINQKKRLLSSLKQYAGSRGLTPQEKNIVTILEKNEKSESLETLKKSSGEDERKVIDKFSILEWLPSQMCVESNLYTYPKKLIHIKIWPVSIVKWGYDISLETSGKVLKGEWQFIDDVYIAGDTGTIMKGEDFTRHGDQVEFYFERKWYRITFLNDMERQSFKENTKISKKVQNI